jgi:excinuclease ABC subunit C
VEGQNDFAMLMEAVGRRLTGLARDHREFPKLLLIDGGKGQLSSARKVLQRFADPPAAISLAKEEEVLYSPYVDDPVRLPETHPVRRLVERIRDEVHRFAVGYHRNLRGKQFRHSTLESLPGVGPTRAAALLRHFGSLAKLRSASVEEIAEVEGFSEAMAGKVREALEREGGEESRSEK